MGSYKKEQGSTSDHGSSDKKCCFDCKTTKTPLWRCGPSGPKTLCNACGIKHRKSRIELTKGKIGKSDGLEFRKQLKMNLMKPLVESSVDQKKLPVEMKKQKSPRPRQWSQVETAALLLMAFSCGAIFD